MKMRHTLHYKVAVLRPLVNWAYFFHAWGMNGKPEQQRLQLRRDAEAMLSQWEARYEARAVFALFDAGSDGDDIVTDEGRIPLLRQQHGGNEPDLCLADFVRPLSSGVADTIGVFATTTDPAMAQAGADPYASLLAQTLADRLAEAATEMMHLEVRRHYWGYAPNESLTTEELHAERFQGIRPAVGYPSMPDTSVNFILNKLIDFGSIGIRLTESGMMMPHASVSGLMLAHPQARYFALGPIGEDQLNDYARRRGTTANRLRPFLQANLRND